MRNAGLGSWPGTKAAHHPGPRTLSGSRVRQLPMRVSPSAFAARRPGWPGLGVRHGDRVAWFSANHPSALETLFACGQLGGIWVPLNARLTAPEAQYILEHAGATVVVYGADQAPQAADLASATPAVRSWVAVESPLAGAASPQPIGYERLLAEADPELRDEPVSLDDPCLIMHLRHLPGAERRRAHPWQHDLERGQSATRLRPGGRRAHARAGTPLSHRRHQRHRQPDAASRRMRGYRPGPRPLLPRSTWRSSGSGSTRSSPFPPCSTRSHASPPSLPRTCRRCVA